MQKQFLTNIQQLRGVAAFIVLLSHVIQSAQKRVYGDNSFLIDGQIGVDIFFVISGFIMVGVTHDAFGLPGSSRNFAIRRIARIVPVYWLFSLLMGALFAAAGQAPTLMQTVTSFLFIPFEQGGRVRPILGQGWTLELEMMFYAIFAVCLLFRRPVGLTLLCVTLVVLPVAGLWIESGPLNFWTSPLVIEFLIGVLIGLAFRTWGQSTFRGHKPIICLIVLAWIVLDNIFGGASTMYDWRIIQWLTAGAVVAVAVFARQDINTRGPLILLGNWSYSLYLVHIVVLLVLAKLSDEIIGERLSPAAGLTYIIVNIVVSLIVAGLSYRWVERPTERYVRKLLKA